MKFKLTDFEKIYGEDRDEQIQINLTLSEREYLDRIASETGIPVSSLVRNKSLNSLKKVCESNHPRDFTGELPTNIKNQAVTIRVTKTEKQMLGWIGKLTGFPLSVLIRNSVKSGLYKFFKKGDINDFWE